MYLMRSPRQEVPSNLRSWGPGPPSVGPVDKLRGEGVMIGRVDRQPSPRQRGQDGHHGPGREGSGEDHFPFKRTSKGKPEGRLRAAAKFLGVLS